MTATTSYLINKVMFTENREIGFIIAGSQKCGTSWLEYNLSIQNNIYMPNRQMNLFPGNNDTRLQLCVKRNISRKSKFIGEKTVEYCLDPALTGLCSWLQLNPNNKAIFVFREPMSRLISAVNHLVYSGNIYPFKNLSDLIYQQNLLMKFGVLEFSNYPKIVKTLKFNQVLKQCLILKFEKDIVQNQFHTIETCLNFIGASVREIKLDKAARKNQKLSRAASRINSYLLGVKRMRKIVDLVDNVIGGSKYEIYNDKLGKHFFREKLNQFEWKYLEKETGIVFNECN